MKKILLLMVVLISGCATTTLTPDPATGLVTYNGNIALSTLKSQEWCDSIEVVNGDVSLGYLMGTDSHAGMANLKQINGNLILDDPVLLDIIEFPKLEKVTGDVTFLGSQYGTPVVKTLNLYNLKHIGGSLTYLGVDSKKFKGLDILILMSLEQIDGNLNIESNMSLKSFSAKRLKSVGGDVAIMTNKKLVILTLNSLEAIQGELTISGNEALYIIDMPNLKTLSYGEITDNLHLSSKNIKLVLLNEVDSLELDDNITVVEKWK